MKVQPIKAHRQEQVCLDGAIGARIRILIGPDDDARNFHMRHFEIEPGGCTPHHQHDFEHEVLVWEGTGIVKSDKGDRPIKRGDVVFIAPNEKHQFCNTGEKPCEFICLIPAPCNCAR